MDRIWAALIGALAMASAPNVGVAAPREVLPSAVVPVRYDLQLKPDPKAMTFTGEVAIALDVKVPTREVVLNAKGLVFDRVDIDGAAAARVGLDDSAGQAKLAFDLPVAAGAHRLRIVYHGEIGRSTLGFFAMNYDTPQGPRRTLATNFEPAAARQLLPCWDEPDHKAVFAVTVDAPANRMAVSNMPVASTTPLPGGLQRVSFEPTPKMSSYLLYLGIGDFERIHTLVDGVEVGVVVKRGDIPKAGYALQQAAALLHWYDLYFGVRYPLPKLDLIAAPGTIDGGSMENWGAIFYSQQHLLFDPKAGTEVDRQLVFLVVAHEMAHQWFGDLVTMTWWDNLWLNEGFARWMQTYVADALHPEWRTGVQAQSIFERGKTADAEVSTHPVLQSIDTVDQAAQAFDDITYDKGAAVITMINAYVGQDRFRDGVRRYMRDHAYGNTVDTDLWSVMQEVAGKPILKIEADFTGQPGLPMVRVGPEAGGLKLAEDRFHSDPAQADTSSRQSWSLPLTVAEADGAATTLLLKDKAQASGAPGALVNAGQTGYARVLYAPAAFDALLPRTPRLAAVDQLGLMNDALALGLAGDAPASRSLAVITQLPSDADPIVWIRATSILLQLDARYGRGPAREAFRGFARRTLAPVAQRVGRAARPGEDAAQSLLRASILEALGKLEEPDVIAWAKMRADDLAAPAAERRTALTIVGASADPATFDVLLARAAATSDPLDKQRLYEALAGTSDPTSAAKLIDVALSGAMPSGSNVEVIMALASDNPDAVWRDTVPRLAEPQAGITPGTQWLMAGMIASQSADSSQITDLEAYVAQAVPESARRPFAGYAAAIRQNQRIRAEVLPEVSRWIAAYAPKTG